MTHLDLITVRKEGFGTLSYLGYSLDTKNEEAWAHYFFIPDEKDPPKEALLHPVLKYLFRNGNLVFLEEGKVIIKDFVGVHPLLDIVAVLKNRLETIKARYDLEKDPQKALSNKKHMRWVLTCIAKVFIGMDEALRNPESIEDRDHQQTLLNKMKEDLKGNEIPPRVATVFGSGKFYLSVDYLGEVPSLILYEMIEGKSYSPLDCTTNAVMLLRERLSNLASSKFEISQVLILALFSNPQQA